MTVNKMEFYSLGISIISVGDIALSRTASWRCAPVARCYVVCGLAVFVTWRYPPNDNDVIW